MAKGIAVLAAVAVLGSLAFGVGRADAGLLGCRYPSEQRVFSSFGDSSNYVPVPGGNFEGWTGWSLYGGARIVSGNEPFYLGSSSDSHSLLLPPGSTAVSPAVCVQVLTPSFRFVGQGGGTVRVTVYTRTLLGLIRLPFYLDVPVSSSWDPSARQSITLENVLGLLNLSSANLYFGFTPLGGQTLQLDDLYLDPFLSR